MSSEQVRRTLVTNESIDRLGLPMEKRETPEQVRARIEERQARLAAASPFAGSRPRPEPTAAPVPAKPAVRRSKPRAKAEPRPAAVPPAVEPVTPAVALVTPVAQAVPVSPSHVPAADVVIVREYVEERLSVGAIARRHGCGTGKVLAALERAGIPQRGPSPRPPRKPKQPRTPATVARPVDVPATGDAAAPAVVSPVPDVSAPQLREAIAAARWLIAAIEAVLAALPVEVD